MTYSTSSAVSLRVVARCPARTSRPRSESALAPAAVPKCFHIRSAPSTDGWPSFNPPTRQPPSSIASISWDYAPRMQTKEDGVRATNQDFIRYDQVEKRQNYQLAEGLDRDQFDDEFQIRTVDIGRFLHGTDEDKRAFATQLGDALHEIGFAILVGHGVDPNLYAEAERRIEEIFTSLTLDEKMRFRAERFGSVNQGYFPIKETSNMHPDLVEGWVFCRRAFENINSFWPSQNTQPSTRSGSM